MTRKEHKMMLQAMREHYTMLLVPCGGVLAFEVASSFGKGWYNSHKKEKVEKTLAN